jgi:hypothetical protein
MLIFKIFSLNNIINYFSYFILIIIIFFLFYKYLYLEQSFYVLSTRLNRLEIDNNNPSIYSPPTSSTMTSAEIIMNEIFNDCSSDNSCCVDGTCKLNTTQQQQPTSPKVVINDEVQIINEIFDLKKETDDKESVISASIGASGGGGHATKKALMKLSLDKLKSQCQERNLSTEGTKNQLADRIIVHDNTVEITDISDFVEE